MKLRGSILAKAVLLPIFVLSAMFANYFIVRGGITAENTFSNATSIEIEKYFKSTGERKVYGSIDTLDPLDSVKQNLQATIVRRNYNQKIYKSNSIYYVSKNTETYTPVRYNFGEIDVKTSVLVMPYKDDEVLVKDYFDLTFLTDISEQFPHGRSSSAIIPKKLADHIIVEKKLNKGSYKSLLNLTASFFVTKGNTWSTQILIAGVYDDSDEKAKFYQEAYGTCIIMPHTADIYYIENVSMSIEFVEKSRKNEELLRYIEVVINTLKNRASWEIYQKDNTNSFKIGSINEVKANSKIYFNNLKNLEISGTNLALSTLLIIVVTGLGFVLAKSCSKKDFKILFMSSCSTGVIASIIIMAITKESTLPLNDFITINRNIEICRASIFLIVFFALCAVAIPKAISDLKKFI